MNFVRLIDREFDFVPEGSILRANLTFLDEWVDLLVFSPNESGFGMGVVYVTGFHAGQVYAVFPKESTYEKGVALSKKWLVENWTKWMDENGSVASVYLAEHYPQATDPTLS